MKAANTRLSEDGADPPPIHPQGTFIAPCPTTAPADILLQPCRGLCLRGTGLSCSWIPDPQKLCDNERVLLNGEFLECNGASVTEQ